MHRTSGVIGAHEMNKHIRLPGLPFAVFCAFAHAFMPLLFTGTFLHTYANRIPNGFDGQ